jgi:hypothetical protein
MTEQENPFRNSPLGERRDPARIDALVSQIAEAWHAHPQMRLLQLLVCTVDHHPNRLFDLEDTVLSTRLRELAESGEFPKAQ